MSEAASLFDPAIGELVAGWLSRQGTLSFERTLPALRWLHGPSGPLADSLEGPRHGREIARALATVAWNDMSVAFSLWCHRMVIEYLRVAESAAARRKWLPSLGPSELVGSTALASAMAHHVGGTPLSIRGRRQTGGVVVEGRIRWASNLFDRQFLLVTAVQVPGDAPLVVAISGDQAGVEVDPHPALLDLQPTFSSSLRFADVRVDEEALLSTDAHRFIRAVRPTFLLWQASFAWGLAARALSEAASHVGRGPNRVFERELVDLHEQRDRIEAAILHALGGSAREPTVTEGGPAAPGELADVVAVRLAAARLAGAASRLECKVVGGAGYGSASATARRLREAAFLPIQSPTEAQLEWELSRSR